jgi:serine/threonine protein kinase
MFLYSAFTAASVLQAQILQDATRLLKNPPAKIQANARRLPAVSRLQKHPTSSGDHLAFEIRGLFHDKQLNRFLYVAETAGTNKQLILIKFARRYSIDLHEFCANSGHAPPILAFERLPGGWFAVAMEYIESGVPITHSSMLSTHRDRWIAELQDLMNSFHDKDLVHGDLRDANIICKDDSVMLIDFDWGGKEGEVSYPTLNLNGELLQGRVSGDLRITKEDDRRVLRNTLAKFVNR